MKSIITLSAVPSQVIGTTLLNNRVQISIRPGNSKTTLLSIKLNDEEILSCYPMAAGDDGICKTPASVNGRLGGHFYFEYNGDSYPEYAKFGRRHFLIWSPES